MKIRISLLVACLVITGISRPIEAEIIKNTLPSQASARAKNLETLLRESGICDHYPVVVKVLSGNTAVVATYADRKFSDKEIKLLALSVAKLISTNVNKIAGIKIRFYDPASTEYWKDIVLSPAQIESGLNSGPDQEQILDSIEIVNNSGLVDGPNLESRIWLYKQILKLQHTGIDVRPYLAQLGEIETAEKKKENVKTQLAELKASLIGVQSSINKPISSNISVSEKENLLKQSFQQACADEATALKAVEEAEQEQRDLALPEGRDWDAQTRYGNDYAGLQRKIDAALAAWQKACRDRGLAYGELQRAKEHY